MNFIVSLVGLSPIPNYITLLNYCNEESKIFLVYSNSEIGVSSSFKIAENIKKVIKNKYKNIEVMLIESSKSDFQGVLRAVDKVKERITSLKVKEKTDLILDITGSTKVNSALFSTELLENFKENSFLNFKKAYLNGFLMKIYEIDSNNNGREYDIEKIKTEKKFEVKEILELYNFDLKKDRFNMNGIKLYIHGMNLLFYKKSEEIKTSKRKEEIFELFNIAERVGGRFTKIVYEALNFKDKSQKENEEKEEKELMEIFLQRFANDANDSYSRRLILKSTEENFYFSLLRKEELKNIKKILGELN